MLELQLKFHGKGISSSLLHGNYFLGVEFNPNFITYVFQWFPKAHHVI